MLTPMNYRRGFIRELLVSTRVSTRHAAGVLHEAFAERDWAEGLRLALG
jgi:hypothetical protein